MAEWTDCTDTELLVAEKMDLDYISDKLTYGTDNKLLAAEKMDWDYISNELTDGTDNELLADENIDWDDISDDDLMTMCDQIDSNSKCEDIDDQKSHSQLIDYLENDK